ncbi:MAG: DUF1624 domain-containing protein [Spirochaetia bacterium]|nr:DUF1624 domain-containing protein [Spirochaetia bacterium]
MTAAAGERVHYLDIAKGFAILFMFTQHCMLVHEYEGGDSMHWLSVLFTIAGTAPAAPVFMLIMGVFLMKSKKTKNQQIIRGIRLLALGFLLNLLRLPMMLPETTGQQGLVQQTLLNILIFNDILQLAGLSVIIGALLKPFMSTKVFPLLVCTGILLVSPLLWGLFPENIPLLMLWGEVEPVHFPVFPWVVYPLLGMYLSRYLLQPAQQLDAWLRRSAQLGFALAVIGGIFLILELFPLGDYSRSGLGLHLLMIGFIGIWLRLCRIIELHLSPESRLVAALTFMSINITMIYFIQWVLFSWSILIFGANEQGPYTAALIGLGVMVLTYGLVKMKKVRSILAFTRV